MVWHQVRLCTHFGEVDEEQETTILLMEDQYFVLPRSLARIHYQ